MATLDSSPSPFPEQTWTHWAKRVEGDRKEDAEADGWPNNADDGSGTMKLRKEDMSLYGLCPSRDEFYLVVCERCGQVIKPQALKKHVELRHKERLSPTVTKSCRVEVKRSVTKGDARSLSSVSMSNLGQNSATSSHPTATSDVTGRTIKHSKSATQLCNPHPRAATELAAVLALAPGGSTSSGRSNHHHTVHHHHKSGRKNHSLAFVKVERMPSPKTMSVSSSHYHQQLKGDGSTSL
ncbi:hypothetical protein NP493_114g03021 [Ridgeia piscesae]|uniref:Ataxin-7-like protein 2 n=1 Tax=Ridgeia piscesae TaxID=27915 RepID=A0AAD9P713_RIDPI|nr:hypothetical protein NP493_114g03021 [Ridgeia piscesae]